MKQFFLCVIFIAITCSVSAQRNFSFELWHDGKIVLESGDTLRGQVKYDLQQDLVQYSSRVGAVEALTARKILFFEIFDVIEKRYRQFYSLPYSTTSGYKTPVLFELLAEGKLTVLCRERLEIQTSSSPYFYGMYSRPVMVYKYFLLKENGDIADLSLKRSDFMQVMGKHADHINDYMKDNKLRLDERPDLIRIIFYYNTLFKTNK